MSPIDVERDDADDDYLPSSAAQATTSAVQVLQDSPKVPKKRGRKPVSNPSIRNAREAARKANHSVIEKKRREKINQALTELRTLVPSSDDGQTSPSTNGSKDFKLEVLVRTVTHLKRLNARLQTLEAAARYARQSATTSSSGSVQSSDQIQSPRVELPPVSSLLVGLPSPPASGSLTSTLPSLDVPPLLLPAPTFTEDAAHSSPVTRHRRDQQTAYSLLSLSARDNAATSSELLGVSQTPSSLLNLASHSDRRARI
nr:bHLH domain containing transcription factor [Serendipita indica]